MKVLFIAGFGPIVRDREASEALYQDALALPLEGEGDGYLHTGALPGAKHFALWPLSQAATSCFGTETWPDHLPTPQAWCEFDVDDVAAATEEFVARGYTLLVRAQREPWGQVVTRFLGPEGMLLALTFTPSMREEGTPQ